MKITLRIWILAAFIVFSLLTIFVSSSFTISYFEKGVLVKFVESNTTIFTEGLRQGDIIQNINGQTISNLQDYEKAMSIFSDNQTHRLDIQAKNVQITDLFPPAVINDISVESIPKTNLKSGLDIQGGIQAVVAAQNHTLTSEELNNLIAISQNRLNLYGLSDVKIYPQDVLGNKFMIVEIAGSSPADLEDLIAKQGKFEAKIANETVFIGGNKDITYVGRSGQDAGVYECFPTDNNAYYCNFRFVIYLSSDAAERHANITSKLGVNLSSGGQYLDKKIDFYVDDKLLESLSIGADLKGKATTQIQVSGSGSGATREEAIADANKEMKKLQTILITGSLPFKLEIVKLDKISPLLGNKFTEAILIGGLCAIFAVSVIIFLRYKKVGISMALLLTSFSELIIILGVAALIHWNLDLPSIAGIIATIGTGVDSQIVILDESRFKTESLKMRIKRALFIIFTAFATAFVSMIPLTGFLGFMGISAAGGGFLKGFAITTMIGITAGVFITRPAFADIARQIEEKNE